MAEIKENGFITFGYNLVAGGLSGIVAKSVTAPLDRVKLLMQTQRINTDLVKQFESPVDCVKRVFKEQGILSFWRGNLANVYRYFPNQAMSFAFKDKYKEFFVGNTDQKKENIRFIIGNLLAGGCAGGSAIAVSYPFEFARTRLATDVGGKNMARKYRGTFDCFIQVQKTEGIRGLYAGFSVAILGAVVFKALYMGGYDILKEVLNLENTHVGNKLLVAQSVTTIVGTFCFPIDTIKRRIMIQRGLIKNNNHTSTVPYKGFIDGFTRILREEGYRGLFAGLSVNLVRGMGGSILLVGYDIIKKQIREI